MPADSKISRSSAIVGFSTYGATPNRALTDLFYQERARLWSRYFQGAKAARVSLLQNGYLPTLPYTDDLQQVIKGKLISAYGQMYSDPRSVFQWHFVFSANRIYVDPFDGEMDTLVAAVQAKLQGKVSGHGLMSAVSVFEADKTVKMIGDAAKTLAQAYRDARKGRWAKAASGLGLSKPPPGVRKGRSFSSNWMEYRYGWRTLVMDVDSLLKTLHTQLTERPPVYRVSAMETKLGRWTWPKTWTFNLPSGIVDAIRVSGFQVDEITRTVRGGYVYELESVPLATGQEFGLLNPFLTAYELVPVWGVVVDWFVNVGDVLEGLTAFQGKRCLTGWLNREIESRRSTYWTGAVKGTGIYRLDPGISCVIPDQTERRFRRSSMGFTPSQLRVDIDLNISRTLDAFAFFKMQQGSMRTSARI